MDHITPMSVIDGFGYICHKTRYLRIRHPHPICIQTSQAFLQRLAGYELHHHIVGVTLMVEVEYLDDARVAELGDSGCFFFEPADKLRIVREVRVNDFNCHHRRRFGSIALKTADIPP